MSFALNQQLIKKTTIGKDTLKWAIISSILLHLLLAFVIPSMQFEVAKKPEVLTIELAPPPAAQLVPIVEPVKPIEPVQPKPIEKTPIKPRPKPVTQPSPISAPPPSVVAEPTPAVITAAPKAEATPAFTAPVANAEPAKPSEADLSGARGQYADMLRREIAKDKNYPNIARTRSYQGDVVLDVKLDSNGKVLSAKVHTSSGYESLDKEAIAKINRISPFPLPPEALKGRTFNVSVPISFKLDV